MYTDLMKLLQHARDNSVAITQYKLDSLPREQIEQMLRTLACRDIALVECIMAFLRLVPSPETGEAQ